MGLATIDAALLTALEATRHTGTPSATQPFAFVGRYAGDFTREGIADVAQGLFPACFLRWDGGTDARTVDALEGTEDVEASAWSVYVALEDARSIDDAVTTSSSSYGLLDLVDVATGVISGLTVEGTEVAGTYAETWRDRRVRVTGRKTALIERGVAYAAQIVVEARITLAQVTPTDTSVNLTSIRGDVEIPEDDAPNPMAVFDPL
jgi:hypothetical protein